ncbi:hypothetical protein Q4I30_001719 [Leishmania utingensis]|uniref:Transmembrane protein n=1 Tax=Leishmania utingensis TaxID=653362 RepID=A0AAW3AVI3_9TRYP
MDKWKDAVTTQLNDAACKNKRLREELRLLREEKESALNELRVQLTEEFHERTAMQQDELATLKQQTATLREEKKTMAATHEEELQTTRMKLREMIQLELKTEYKRREEHWEKEKTQLQARMSAKETERAQAEHECDVLKLRLNRLGTQYDELATLFQPESGVTSLTHGLEAGDYKASGTGPENAPLTPAGAPGAGSATLSTNGSSAVRQQAAVAATHAKQLESIKAELQSKEQHAQFLLDRAKQEREAEKTQLLREQQLREEELKVAHTLLKQVQMENSRYMERILHAQTERQALEQRYAAKVSALSQELAERIRAADETQIVNKHLQEQLRTFQQQVATLEEESTMREEAFHALMFSEDNKQAAMDLQRAAQAARDEAEEWKMQYYASVTGSHSPTATAAAASQPGPSLPKSAGADDAHGSAAVSASAEASARTPQAWHDQLAAREANLNSQEAQLARKAALLAAAEAKLNKMRSSMANQASLLLQQSKSSGRDGGSSDVGDPHGRRGDSDSRVFIGGDDRGSLMDDDRDRDLSDVSPLIFTAASLLPSALHGSLRLLEAQRRRLHLPGKCDLYACCFSGGVTTGAPRRLRRNALLITVMVFMLLLMLASLSAIV